MWNKRGNNLTRTLAIVEQAQIQLSFQIKNEK